MSVAFERSAECRAAHREKSVPMRVRFEAAAVALAFIFVAGAVFAL